MHFQLVEKRKTPVSGLWRGVWLAALMGALLSLVDSLQYFYAVLPGVAIVIAAGFLPWKWQKVVGVVSFAFCVIWLVLRLMPIGDGLGFLANQLFDLSEEGQDYYYTHFDVVRNAPAESVFFVTCALGAICLLLGGAINLVLTLLLAIMIAYFGVAPDIVWLSVLIVAAFANALPKQGRWLPAILIAAFVATTAISVQTVAPEPSVRISAIAEALLELFEPETPPEDVEPPPTEPSETLDIPDIQEFPETLETIEIPEGLEMPAATALPQIPQMPQPQNPGGEPPQKESKRLPIIPILTAILSVFSVWGLWLLYIGKKRKRNRAAMYAQNNAEAIRGMFLYAKRWRKLNVSPKDIPSEVEDIWLEAAYSEHEMSAAQRETMLSFVRYSAADTWNTLSWWKRLLVCFYQAL